MNIASTEVVIVGAGFSGLAAARILKQSHIAFEILEARDRLGGRVYTKKFDQGYYLDFGGQWIGPTQDRMYALCEEYGVSFYETYNQGKNILDLKGKIKTYSGVIPKLDLFSLLNLDWVIRKLERLAKKIPMNSPWTHPKAQKWDHMTLEDFLKSECKTNSSYAVLRAGCETIFACDPEELSFLHALFYIKSGTSLDCLINIKNGAQQHRIQGGMQLLAEKISEGFQEDIHFNSPVKQILTRENGYTVFTSEREIICKQVIIAIPPPLLKEIGFQPALPQTKTGLLENYPMGQVAKCFLIYEKPFWRTQGFSGQSVSDENTPYQTLFDCSPSDGSKGILMGFSIGSRARNLFKLPKEEREKTMRKVANRYFGPMADDYLNYEDFFMTDETWSQGCYAALMQPKAWTSFQDAYRNSVGNIHFAGTEAATRWHGYIEGAVLAGEAAAEKVLQNLDS
ncbi:monoamine oxidase [Algoriphagus boseongensis]|uniref:Monoamine oxidase n=1 Tax=Algoriphagus boseongensis TaxID=1442587 RepID=A0A4R6TB22_9BACT|nr:FAD-dependent oxidoreductase [Algoriphagus boseongensis]TDQ19433.1 monoamine oxidase [Algoriphagus boseongensis]